MPDARGQIDRSTKGQPQCLEAWELFEPRESPAGIAEGIFVFSLTVCLYWLGLSRDELLSRLATALPSAVDSFTPEGRLPTEN